LDFDIYYVYTISVDGIVHYVGAGQGWRIFAHLRALKHPESALRDHRCLYEPLLAADARGAIIEVWKISEGLTQVEALVREALMIASHPPEQLWNENKAEMAVRKRERMLVYNQRRQAAK
jgi:hypothetical protein